VRWKGCLSGFYELGIEPNLLSTFGGAEYLSVGIKKGKTPAKQTSREAA